MSDTAATERETIRAWCVVIRWMGDDISSQPILDHAEAVQCARKAHGTVRECRVFADFYPHDNARRILGR